MVVRQRGFTVDRRGWRARWVTAINELRWLRRPLHYRRLLRGVLPASARVGPLKLDLRGGVSVELANREELLTFHLIFIQDLYAPSSDYRRKLKNAVVLDVGAHAGLFALYAALIGAKRVIAVEPLPQLAARLAAIAAIPEVRHRISVVRGALSATDSGVIEIHVDDAGALGHSAFARGDRIVRVSAVALDSLLGSDERIDYFKFNCEGCEYEVLRTLDPAMLAPGAVGLVGWHELPGLPTREVLIEHLNGLGFEVKELDNPDLQFYVAARDGAWRR